MTYIALCCVLSRQIEKQLFNVPIKNWLQMWEKLRKNKKRDIPLQDAELLGVILITQRSCQNHTTRV